MSGNWHLEHRDGREWTWEELGQLITDIQRRSLRLGHYECREVLLSRWGDPVLLDETGVLWTLGDCDMVDVRVVWDD